MQRSWQKQGLLVAAKTLKPPKNSSTVEWLESELHLPESGAVLSGLYQFHFTPYFIGIANALDKPSVDEIVLMKAAQIGWTYFLIGYMLKRVVEQPCPIMALFAKAGDGKAFHDEKFVPSVLATPAARALIDVSTSRKSGNRWDHKNFPSGFIKFVGSGSPGNVKSTSSVGLAIIEEPDDTSENVKGQGDSIGLLEERVKRYPGSKFVTGGTPAIKGLSKVEFRLKRTEQHVLPVVCHDCGAADVLDFENVTWLEDKKENHEVYGHALPDTAAYACPECGSIWDDYQRQENIRSTVFNAVAAGDEKAGWVGPGNFDKKVGFYELGELYSCLPGVGMVELVQDYLTSEHLAAQGDEKQKIKFVNQKLGRGYEFKGEEAEPDDLREQVIDYKEMQMPLGALLVTIGIDVQHDRLAIIIRAWGRGDESWLLYWGEIAAGHTTVDKKDEVWNYLDETVFQVFESVSGWGTYASAISIDSSDGTTSDAVYHWVRTRSKRYKKILIMAVKGSSAQTDPEVFVTPKAVSVDHKNPEKRTKADKFGVKVYIVGTNKGKDYVTGQLMLEASGRGRFHYYKDVRDDYFEQVTSEVKAPHKTVRHRKVWQLKAGRRNEALDCEDYALHAARAKRVHLMKANQWDLIESELSQVDLFSLIAPETDQVVSDKKEAKKGLFERLNG